MFKNRDLRDGLDLSMKRIDRICQELERLTLGLNQTDLQNDVAFTAESIGFNLGLARNSVSKDLNQLWSEQRVIKVKTRPVYFLHREVVETLIGHVLPDHLTEVRFVSELLPSEDPLIARDPFTALIGYDRSLKLAVEKGKAAVLYPSGLHVLLTGPSGVGKTYFAELMHQFACQQSGNNALPLV